MLGFFTHGFVQCGIRGETSNLLSTELSNIWQRCLKGLNGGRFFEGDIPNYKEWHPRKTLYFF